MPTNFRPQSSSDYTSESLKANFKGTSFTSTANLNTTNDFLISEDNLIGGVQLHCIGATIRDKITFQVFDKNNLLGNGNNYVVDQFITDWHINPQVSEQFNYVCEYPYKIVAGLYIRTTYKSIGLSDVEVLVNFRLHKVIW